MFFFRRAEQRHAALLREILANRASVQQLEKTMSEKFETLRAEVAAERTVTASAIALISGLTDRLKAASESEDKGELDAIIADLQISRADLAKAVAEGTGVSLAQAAAASGPLPESVAVVDAHPANGGTGSGPLDNVAADQAAAELPPADAQKQAGQGDPAAQDQQTGA
jgi:ribosomal protein L7/L12